MGFVGPPFGLVAARHVDSVAQLVCNLLFKQILDNLFMIILVIDCFIVLFAFIIICSKIIILVY